ncbi:FadR/GntR family transcriptional regulator [Reinekea blandensis]|uniref:Pyruvate dehydrogenase complex repressor n=1 Tax=Reinekea blandensis MED297 TaxID=314283 RepID=A4BC68_9GAMM|nr:FadR/GntR family transcriptional regulator [Reinekea blandensis]EAR10134.1 probable transcriptional regulator [Reinekea sp. MED297] [Reinekea blandensis MED297]
MNRLDDVLALMKIAIRDGDWPVDTRLPSERTLAADYQVSRATIREALTALRQQGCIASVVGSGHYVRSDTPETLPDLVEWQQQTFSHEELREYRQAIESQTAFLAAQRASENDLKAIERAHRHLKHAHRQGDLKAEGLADARFHLAIAQASGNQILALTLNSLFTLLRANVTRNIGTMSRRPETRLRLMKQHTALFEAIYYRKPDRARQLAQEHMAFVDTVLADASP